MKKLLLLALVAFAVLATGCDRDKYAAHRSERSKPKTEVTPDRIAIRRAPFPNLDILPDGQLRVDDIVIPLKPEQRELLQASFVKLQILRQNTLTDAASNGTDPASRTVRIEVPANQPVFPADIGERIPEFKEYAQALANTQAVR